MAANPDATIRQIAPEEASLYRSIRLEALQKHPEAFGSDFAFENAQPLEWFVERVKGSQIFGAFCHGEIVGTTALLIQSGIKKEHKGYLWAVYVRAELRGSGIGRKLIEAALNAARQRVELVQLSVEATNQAARHLYISLGFEDYGTERKALKIEGRYYDEILMAKALSR